MTVPLTIRPNRIGAHGKTFQAPIWHYSLDVDELGESFSGSGCCTKSGTTTGTTTQCTWLYPLGVEEKGEVLLQDL